MNKSQLIEIVATQTGADRREVERTVTAMLATIYDTLERDEPVVLSGFGTFARRARAARPARNPRTGERVHVPCATVPSFRPGARLRRHAAAGAPV